MDSVLVGSSSVSATVPQQIRWFLDRLGKTRGRGQASVYAVEENLRRRGYEIVDHSPATTIGNAIRKRFGDEYTVVGHSVEGPGFTVRIPTAVRYYLDRI
jgi:erythromycin esterase-like protein